MEENCRIFAQNLTRLLAETGKTQAEVADELKINRSTFNTWCKGTAYPRISKIQQLADYFAVGKSTLTEKQDTKAYNLSGILRLVRYAEILNAAGIAKLEERAEELSEIPKYKKALPDDRSESAH